MGLAALEARIVGRDGDLGALDTGTRESSMSICDTSPATVSTSSECKEMQGVQRTGLCGRGRDCETPRRERVDQATDTGKDANTRVTASEDRLACQILKNNIKR